MSDDKKDKGGKKSLDDAQIGSDRSPNRRTVLRGFGIGTLGLGTAAVTGCVAVPGGVGVIGGSGYTDRDNGPITDPGGFGRGPRRGYYTGITDRDNGPITDPGGQGRG